MDGGSVGVAGAVTSLTGGIGRKFCLLQVFLVQSADAIAEQ